MVRFACDQIRTSLRSIRGGRKLFVSLFKAFLLNYECLDDEGVFFLVAESDFMVWVWIARVLWLVSQR